MSRLTKAKEWRALRKPKPPQRVERVPTGGGRFFRAGQPEAAVDPEHIRGVFRQHLAGTALGKRLGYGT